MDHKGELVRAYSWSYLAGEAGRIAVGAPAGAEQYLRSYSPTLCCKLALVCDFRCVAAPQ